METNIENAVLREAVMLALDAINNEEGLLAIRNFLVENLGAGDPLAIVARMRYAEW